MQCAARGAIIQRSLPMKIERHILANGDAVAAAAAELVVTRARSAIERSGRFLIALSGGSTPRLLYQKLASPPLRDRIEWRRLEFFWSDERAVPPDHPDSNFRMANEALL